MAGEKGSMVYLASEQAAIEIVCPGVENVAPIDGGVPYVVQLDEVAARKAQESCENVPAKDRLQEHLTGVLPASSKGVLRHA